jgi:large subunit ribosomal protein L17
MFSDLLVALFLHGKIKTTVTRAKEVQPLADRLVLWARQGTLSSKRKLQALVKDRARVKMIIEKSLSRFEGRSSGFTRLIRVGSRRGDAAPLACLELV